MDNADLVLLELGIKYSELVLYTFSINHFPNEFDENFPKNRNSYVWVIDGDSDFILNELMLKDDKKGTFIREYPKGRRYFKRKGNFYEFFDVKKS